MKKDSRGPGLAKTRGLPLISRKTVELARSCDAKWRALFDEADAMSEGGVRIEAGGPVWYGTTSVILVLDDLDAGLRREMAAMAACDMHIRLRALRLAYREAIARAPSPLDCAHCELQFKPDPRGIRIDVDVQAPLMQSARGTSRA